MKHLNKLRELIELWTDSNIIIPVHVIQIVPLNILCETRMKQKVSPLHSYMVVKNHK